MAVVAAVMHFANCFLLSWESQAFFVNRYRNQFPFLLVNLQKALGMLVMPEIPQVFVQISCIARAFVIFFLMNKDRSVDRIFDLEVRNMFSSTDVLLCFFTAPF